MTTNKIKTKCGLFNTTQKRQHHFLSEYKKQSGTPRIHEEAKGNHAYGRKKVRPRIQGGN